MPANSTDDGHAPEQLHHPTVGAASLVVAIVQNGLRSGSPATKPVASRPRSPARRCLGAAYVSRDRKESDRRCRYFSPGEFLRHFYRSSLWSIPPVALASFILRCIDEGPVMAPTVENRTICSENWAARRPRDCGERWNTGSSRRRI